ncbi:phospholipase D family protein [Marinicella sp. S1101]|uniref:phospholipase D family protein n=1 Tax=Marinicella marina TaxID=2996016 RepID=UPI002260D613|nr:phospholipase D family protein [Marinicella marina]MCX7554878.1 phospholipase D family protein [Marinicella marina]MDJ1141536.1 phospholipase D family protein [Marinicella marina]
MKRITFKHLVRWLLLYLLLLWISLMLYHSHKPLPAGISSAAPAQPVVDARFLADYTWVDQNGLRQTDQRIFDRILSLINQAERMVVLDMFLFNDFAGDPGGSESDPNMRPLSAELATVLMQRKAKLPDLRVVLITDPINHIYGGIESARLQQLADAGVEVIMTDLNRLRDSNFLYSGLWRLCCYWLGNSSRGGWLPNPVGTDKVTLRTWLKLANFKANHRKMLVVDSNEKLIGLVTSGNPHDASSAHGNVALEFTGPSVADLLATEQAVLDFSTTGIEPLATAEDTAVMMPSDTTIQVLTESKIRDYVINTLNQSGHGDRIDLAMFYLSHRGIIKALTQAHERGANLRVLLDPSEDAFGKKKNGMPNRQVAAELNQAGIPVRWCDTHGEQCHSKMMLKQSANERAELLLGSANFTRRNLDDLNLETNVLLLGDKGIPAMADASAFFELYWKNGPDQFFSRPYEYYADEGRLRYWRYRIMEATGLSTF